MAEVKIVVALANSLDEILKGVCPGFLPFIDMKLLRGALAEIDKLGDGGRLMPGRGRIFEWLRYFGPDDMVGCVVGQDPYPDGATGICFAKDASEGMPKSFAPIVKCLEKQGLMAARADRHADLRPLVGRGLVAPNMALTTRAGTSKAHQKIWKPFMTEFFTRMCKYAQDAENVMFFLLWGGEAQKGVEKIAKKYGHVVFAWSHPSPLADNLIKDVEKKFVNCTNFASADAHLVAQGKRRFCWDNMARVMAFADGACSGNGKTSATGGLGALILGGVFGRTTISERVHECAYELVDKDRLEEGFRPMSSDETLNTSHISVTNNRAELLALCWIFLALLRGFALGPVVVYTDSNLCVQTLNDWLPKRRRKGTAGELKNQDLLAIAEPLMEAVKARAAAFSLEHVPASHDAALPAGATDLEKLKWGGNDTVDRLAKRAKEAQLPLEIASPIPSIRALGIVREITFPLSA